MKRHYIWHVMDAVKAIFGNVYPYALKEYKKMLEWEIEFLEDSERALHAQHINAIIRRLK